MFTSYQVLQVVAKQPKGKEIVCIPDHKGHITSPKCHSTGQDGVHLWVGAVVYVYRSDHSLAMQEQQ